jgi:very-short-patch-repair endonuclease
MLLCLPPRLGGYGIALPELNRRIELTLKEQLAIGVHHFLCDLYWADRGVAVEYDSARFHSVLEKQERDAIRRNMLQYKGIHVISATRLQVSSEAQFDNLARQIALRTGKRLRTPTRAQVTARRALRETLFDWDVLQQSPIDAEW